MGQFSNKTSFMIEADANPAINEFGRMRTDYQSILAQMGGKIDSFESTATQALTKVSAAAKRSSSSVHKIGTSAEVAGPNLEKAFLMGVAGVSNLDQALVAVTRSLQRMTVHALKLVSDFETGLAEISTLLDSHLVPQMGAFADQLRQISVTGDQSLKTLSKATYDAISAGISGFKEQIEVVKEADIAATAGLSKTSIAMSAFVRLKNAWKDDAGTYREINDLLFQTVKYGLTTFPQMASAIGNVAGTAAQAGLSMKETLAAFAAVTRVTKNSTTSMTYLRNLIVAILSPSQKAKQAFEELGISYGQAALQSKGLIGIMREVKNATGGAAEHIAQLFPNQRAQQAAMTLAGRGIVNFQEALESMDKSAGSSQEAYKKMANTWTFETARATNIVSALLADLYGPTFDRIKVALASFNQWYLDNQETVDAWARGIGTVVGGVIDVFAGVGKVLWAITYPIRWILENNPFVWVFKNVGRYEKYFNDRKKDLADLEDQTRKANAAMQQMEMVQRQIMTGGEELSTALQKLMERMSKLNSEQRESIRLSVVYRLEAVRKIIQLEEERTRLFEQGKLKEAAAINASLIPLKKQHNLMGVGVDYLQKEEKAAERVLEAIKHKTERLTETGLAGIAASRMIVRGYSQEMQIEIKRQADFKKIEALRLKDKEKWTQAASAIDAYYDRQQEERRRREERKSDRTDKEPKLAAIVKEYASRRAKLEKEDEKENAFLDRAVEKSLDRLQKDKDKKIAAIVKDIGKDVLSEEKADIAVDKAMVKYNAILAKKDRATYWDIIFGTEDQLKAKYGTMLATLGKTTDDLKDSVSKVFSGDMLARAGAWWGAFVGLGSKAAVAFAGQIQSMYQSLAQGVGNTIASLVAGLVSGQQDAMSAAGQQFLEVIANMAMMMGSYLMTTGIGLMFVPPYTGAGAVAAGAALMALGGLVRGVGSLVGGNKASSVASGGGGGHSMVSEMPKTRDRLPGTGTVGQQPIQYFFVVDQGEPWDRRTPQERFRSFRGWSESMARATGSQNPFERRMSVGGRR